MYRHPLFPIAILLLSLALGFFIWRTGRPSIQEQVAEQHVRVEQQYEQAMQTVLVGFLPAFDAAANEGARAELIEQTSNILLDLTVPSERRGVHLELVITLNEMQRALGNEEGLAAARARWEQLAKLF